MFDPAHDLILRFSGGHSAYSGTAPVVYDVKTDRYSLPFAPEYPSSTCTATTRSGASGASGATCG